VRRHPASGPSTAAAHHVVGECVRVVVVRCSPARLGAAPSVLSAGRPWPLPGCPSPRARRLRPLHGEADDVGKRLHLSRLYGLDIFRGGRCGRATSSTRQPLPPYRTGEPGRYWQRLCIYTDDTHRTILARQTTWESSSTYVDTTHSTFFEADDAGERLHLLRHYAPLDTGESDDWGKRSCVMLACGA